MKKVSVAAFGSCRLLTPLAVLSRDPNQSIEVVNSRDIWYTHYLQEHIQKIEVLTGRKTFKDNDLFKFIIDNDVQKHYPDKIYQPYSNQTSPDFFKALDVFIIEVSTSRAFKIKSEGEDLYAHLTLVEKRSLRKDGQLNYLEFFSSKDDLVFLLNKLRSIIPEDINLIFVTPPPYSSKGATKDNLYSYSKSRLSLIRVLAEFASSHPKTYSLDIDCVIAKYPGGVNESLVDSDHFCVAFKHFYSGILSSVLGNSLEVSNYSKIETSVDSSKFLVKQLASKNSYIEKVVKEQPRYSTHGMSFSVDEASSTSLTTLKIIVKRLSSEWIQVRLGTSIDNHIRINFNLVHSLVGNVLVEGGAFLKSANCSRDADDADCHILTISGIPNVHGGLPNIQIFSLSQNSVSAVFNGRDLDSFLIKSIHIKT